MSQATKIRAGFIENRPGFRNEAFDPVRPETLLGKILKLPSATAIGGFSYNAGEEGVFVNENNMYAWRPDQMTFVSINVLANSGVIFDVVDLSVQRT